MTKDQIPQLIAAIRRLEDSIDSCFPFEPGVDVCCQNCKWSHSDAYQAAIEKLHRQTAWLAVLEAKRKRPPRRRPVPSHARAAYHDARRARWRSR